MQPDQGIGHSYRNLRLFSRRHFRRSIGLRPRLLVPDIGVRITGADNLFVVAFVGRSAVQRQVAQEWINGQERNFVRMDAFRRFEKRDTSIAARWRAGESFAHRLYFCHLARVVFASLPPTLLKDSLLPPRTRIPS